MTFSETTLRATFNDATATRPAAIESSAKAIAIHMAMLETYTASLVESTEKPSSPEARELLERIDPQIREELSRCSPLVRFLYILQRFRWTAPEPVNATPLSFLSNEDIRYLTRFSPEALKKVRRLLGIPDSISTRSSIRLTGDEALFIFLTRMAHLWQLETLQLFFGYTKKVMVEATEWVMWFVHRHWDFLLDDFCSVNHEEYLSRDRLALFARKVHETGAPLPACWGFIGCTTRPTGRPKKAQSESYNGVKRINSLKYSAVKSPDGLIYHLHGPVESKRADDWLLVRSNLKERIKMHSPGFYIYGDSAYSNHLSGALIVPFDDVPLSDRQQVFNQRMADAHEASADGFEDVVRLWRGLEALPTQYMSTYNLGVQYRVAVLLTNIHICVYGSETSSYFECCPPNIEQYLKKPEVEEEAYVRERPVAGARGLSVAEPESDEDSEEELEDSEEELEDSEEEFEDEETSLQ
jgi:hypothetical protein